MRASEKLGGGLGELTTSNLRIRVSIAILNMTQVTINIYLLQNNMHVPSVCETASL